MITAVTLNAAIDKTYYVTKFETGRVHRVTKQLAEPGGKGNNVAKIVRLLGGEVTASGFVAGGNGAMIERMLSERGIPTAFVQVQGESRLCLNIIDEESGASTEVLEQGPAVTEANVAELKDRIRRLAAQSKIVAFSGSLPQGAEAGLYSELIGIARAEGARVYLDTSGKALSESLAAKPDFIKPNEHELAQWLGKDSLTEAEVIEAAQKLSKDGIREVCITLGGEGAVAVIDGAVYRVKAPVIEAVNTVGCGDSFVGGMAHGEVRGLSPEERLRIATAAAAANAMSERAGHLEHELYETYLTQVDVRPL